MQKLRGKLQASDMKWQTHLRIEQDGRPEGSMCPNDNAFFSSFVKRNANIRHESPSWSEDAAWGSSGQQGARRLANLLKNCHTDVPGTFSGGDWVVEAVLIAFSGDAMNARHRKRLRNDELKEWIAFDCLRDTLTPSVGAHDSPNGLRFVACVPRAHPTHFASPANSEKIPIAGSLTRTAGR